MVDNIAGEMNVFRGLYPAKPRTQSFKLKPTLSFIIYLSLQSKREIKLLAQASEVIFGACVGRGTYKEAKLLLIRAESPYAVPLCRDMKPMGTIPLRGSHALSGATRAAPPVVSAGRARVRVETGGMG
jgi:hypothetical protein